MTDRVSAPPGRPGVRWRLTDWATRRSRSTRYRRFMTELAPTGEMTVLDVGVAGSPWRDSNFLEARYPWPERIVGVSPQKMPAFAEHFPNIRLVEADGRSLPFADQSFDIGFSNAVVEHVGSRAEQRRFVAEILRVCGRVFVSTPNRSYPIDPHTLLPFAHWLPRRTWEAILRRTGNARWAKEDELNPLTARELLAMFPASSRPSLIRQRMFGLTSVLIVVADGTPDAGRDSRAAN